MITKLISYKNSFNALKTQFLRFSVLMNIYIVISKFRLYHIVHTEGITRAAYLISVVEK